MAPRPARLLGALFAAAALPAGCGTAPIAPTDATGPSGLAWHVPDADDLRAYGDCAELQRDLDRRQAQRIPASLAGDLPSPYQDFDSFASGPIDVDVQVPTRTNVTENGVDEPARWAADGHVLVRPDGTKLRLYDVSGPSPVERGVLNIGDAGMSAGSVLLAGSRALLIGGAKPDPRGGYAHSGPPPAPGTTPHPGLAVPDPTWLALVDLADPDRPRLVSVERTQGALLIARLRGTTARVVTRHPGPLSGPLWREVWDGTGTAVKPDPNPACTDIRHTAARSRPGMLAVETVNLGRDDGLAAATTTGVVGATLAYHSASRLYLTTPAARPGDPVGVHSFDAGPAPETPYTGSGNIDGYVHGAWAMSERDGHLRVLASDKPSPPWRDRPQADGAQPRPGAARIVVLDAGDGLRQVGRTSAELPGALFGRANIRWVDDLALVHLDKATGPLRVVDLTDPRGPVLAGTIRSADTLRYLHPTGDGTILGAGEAADKDSRYAGRLAVSVLDLGNPDEPRRESNLDFGRGGASGGRWQADAVSYDAGRRVALLIGSFDTGDVCPPGQYCLSGGDQVPANCRPVSSCSGFSGPAEIPTLLAIRVGTGGELNEAGRWTGGEIQTVVPLGDRVAVVDYARITLVDPVTLEPSGSLVISEADLNPNTDDFYPAPGQEEITARQDPVSSV